MKKPRIGAMRVVRFDKHNWATEQYLEVTSKEDGSKSTKWKVVGYYSVLKQACLSALNDATGGEGAQQILDQLKVCTAEILASVKALEVSK